MGIFNRIVEMVALHNQRIPFEDVSTEILIYVLNRDPGMLDSFVNEVLLVEGYGFTVSTRRSYQDEQHGITIPDVTFKNKHHLVFLENKVHAPEGFNQLLRYRNVLHQLASGREVHLRYCTINSGEKNVDQIDFLQIRWVDVARFLKRFEDRDLVAETLVYLEENSMANLNGFTIEDVAAMSRLGHLSSVIETCLIERPKATLSDLFGKTKQVSLYSQIPEHKRIAVWSENVIGNTYSEVLIGFQFETMLEKPIPVLVTQLFCERNDEYTKTLISQAHSSSIFTGILDESYGILLYREIDVTSFLPSDNQIQDIQDWFVKGLESISDFRKSTSDLPWRSN